MYTAFASHFYWYFSTEEYTSLCEAIVMIFFNWRILTFDKSSSWLFSPERFTPLYKSNIMIFFNWRIFTSVQLNFPPWRNIAGKHGRVQIWVTYLFHSSVHKISIRVAATCQSWLVIKKHEKFMSKLKKILKKVWPSHLKIVNNHEKPWKNIVQGTNMSWMSHAKWMKKS